MLRSEFFGVIGGIMISTALALLPVQGARSAACVLGVLGIMAILAYSWLFFAERRKAEFKRLRIAAEPYWNILTKAFDKWTEDEFDRGDLRGIIAKSPWLDSDKDAPAKNMLCRFAREVHPKRGSSILGDKEDAYADARRDIRETLESWGNGMRGPCLKKLLTDQFAPAHKSTLSLYWYLEDARDESIGTKEREYKYLERIREVMGNDQKR